MEVIHESPQHSSFIPLSEHQSQTPQSFYSGQPVLHYQSAGADLVAAKSGFHTSLGLSKLAGYTNVEQGNAENGDNSGEDIVLKDIDIWVTSEYSVSNMTCRRTELMIITRKFILYSPTQTTGLSISYRSISLHAVQRLRYAGNPEETQALYLQIDTTDGFDDHDQDGSIELSLVPRRQSEQNPAGDHNAPTDSSSVDGHEPFSHTNNASTPTSELYNALSACANLHPDSISPSSSTGPGDNEEDVPSFEYEAVDGLPPAMPGSGGWITAENMNQFFDEEGNWRGGGLGPGAGTVRERENDDEEGTGTSEVNGPDGETKWRRTE